MLLNIYFDTFNSYALHPSTHNVLLNTKYLLNFLLNSQKTTKKINSIEDGS
ncbi:hypothetical protein K737_301012 [Holospora undulata HU1]|uniref:Uncharacterized protein n=1 Tax=Holospora undulata HU1 TaxID=1321371 RepID=A0A061JFW3_9PROT|nr:hypothetical protein K737_301012 [Holospora undulata HU1]